MVFRTAIQKTTTAIAVEQSGSAMRQKTTTSKSTATHASMVTRAWLRPTPMQEIGTVPPTKTACYLTPGLHFATCYHTPHSHCMLSYTLLQFGPPEGPNPNGDNADINCRVHGTRHVAAFRIAF